MIDNPELGLDPELQIHAPPAHDAIGHRIRAGLDHAGQFRQLRFCQLRRCARCLEVEKTFRPRFVEAVHPVPQDLAVHATDLRGRRPAHAIINRRDRQQPARLIGVITPRGMRTSLSCIKVLS